MTPSGRYVKAQTNQASRMQCSRRYAESEAFLTANFILVAPPQRGLPKPDYSQSSNQTGKPPSLLREGVRRTGSSLGCPLALSSPASHTPETKHCQFIHHIAEPSVKCTAGQVNCIRREGISVGTGITSKSPRRKCGNGLRLGRRRLDLELDFNPETPAAVRQYLVNVKCWPVYPLHLPCVLQTSLPYCSNHTTKRSKPLCRERRVRAVHYSCFQSK